MIKKPTGILIVKFIKAIIFENDCRVFKVNLFLTAHFDQEKFTTEVVSSKTNEHNLSDVVSIDECNQEQLYIEAWNKNRLFPDHLIGTSSISLLPVITGLVFESSFILYKKKKNSLKEKGIIYIKFEFIPIVIRGLQQKRTKKKCKDEEDCLEKTYNYKTPNKPEPLEYRICSLEEKTIDNEDEYLMQLMNISLTKNDTIGLSPSNKKMIKNKPKSVNVLEKNELSSKEFYEKGFAIFYAQEKTNKNENNGLKNDRMEAIEKDQNQITKLKNKFLDIKKCEPVPSSMTDELLSKKELKKTQPEKNSRTWQTPQNDQFQTNSFSIIGKNLQNANNDDMKDNLEQSKQYREKQ